LFFLPADTLSFGVVASKKTFGIAVKRNRAKRRLRELFRLIAKAGILKTGKFVLIGRKAVLTEEFSRLQSELEKCLKKA
jgi:ribonuclease P protein component